MECEFPRQNATTEEIKETLQNSKTIAISSRTPCINISHLYIFVLILIVQNGIYGWNVGIIRNEYCTN